MHQALPELDFDELDTSTEFFGKRLNSPLMITSMTGGADFAEELNHGLAAIAARRGIAFAVGSQRVMIGHPEVTPHFSVRAKIPVGVLLGNIGAVQLVEHPIDVIAGLVETIEADGICVHLNAGQELVQLDGNRKFRGLLDGIARLLDALEGKVLVKETGAGLSPQTLERLEAIGVPYIDVAGAGGTSWTRVESHRESNDFLAGSGDVFGDWGIPTAVSVFAARRILGERVQIVASGGLINGLDAARAIALGADVAGYARLVLLAFLDKGAEGVERYLDSLEHELKMTMLMTGATNVSQLHDVPRVYLGRLHQWLVSLGWL